MIEVAMKCIKLFHRGSRKVENFFHIQNEDDLYKHAHEHLIALEIINCDVAHINENKNDATL